VEDGVRPAAVVRIGVLVIAAVGAIIILVRAFT
jgi:hypothetical protein